MKTELKNCLSLYKIFYSCAFILILCAIHPIIYYEEIGSAILQILLERYAYSEISGTFILI